MTSFVRATSSETPGGTKDRVESPPPLRVAMLTRYGAMGASSRVRALQFRPMLATQGVSTTVFPLLGDNYLHALYAGQRDAALVLRAYLRRIGQCPAWRRHDLLWIEKELFPMLPAWCELGLLSGQPYVLDFDDAVFHTYDRSRHASVRALLGRKVDRLMRGAALVTVGNAYLAARAQQAGAGWVERLPSCIDLQRYPAPVLSERQSGPLRIVWIGSPATVSYLNLLREPLLALSARRPLALHVIGAAAPAWTEGTALKVREITWQAESEVSDLTQADVGVMPLLDTPWEQGKCSFKLVQYMACGLPVVASPVGMNCDVVQAGVNGWLASTTAEWIDALELLADDPSLRERMGQEGRRSVETQYSIQAQAPCLATWLRTLASR